MTFTLKIDCNNAAFGNSDREAAAEVGQILYTVRQRLAQGETYGKVRDINGNTVGEFTFCGERETDEDEEATS